MKKQLLTIVLGLVAMFTVSTSFAAPKASENTTKVEGNKTTVFNKNGKLVYTIERFTPDALPKDVMDIVSDQYGPHYISGIEKIEAKGAKPVYIVHMQDRKTVKTVRVSGNDTQLINDYVKG